MNNDAGFMGDREENFHIWERNAERWPGVRTPWRPSRGDVEKYRALSGESLQGRILILGSTPELRDLVARESSIPSVIADASLAMLLRGTQLLQSADPMREIWVKGDWTNLPLAPASFDLVLGDMIWWVLPVSAQENLAAAIRTALKPHGRWVSRFRLHDQTRLAQTPSSIIERYLARFRESADTALLCGELLSALYDATADVAGRRLSRASTDAALEEAARHLSADEAERQFLLGARERIVGADWTVQGREEILAQIATSFTLESEARADDYDADHYPVWAFTKHEPSH